jgi:hypothetical protein
MNNLIITVIAIALVCLTSLIGIYYGGSMLGNNDYGADAPAVVNLGSQVAGAWGNFVADYRPANPSSPFPATWATLVNAGYLPSLKQLPPMPGSRLNLSSSVLDISTQNQGYIYEDNASVWYYFADVGRPSKASAFATDMNGGVCQKILAQINISAISSVATITDAVLNNTAYGNGTYGCFYWTGGSSYKASFSDNPNSNQFITTGGDYVFFYRLGS